MKVLIINKFHYMAGGAERFVFDWAKTLRARGHEVMFFSMRHPANAPCAEEEFFAPQVSFDMKQSPIAKVRAALHSIWSRAAATCLKKLLRARGKPDIAHLNSFMFQLTPSILGPLAGQGVPMIQTCHEYAHICANQHLYNQRTGTICAECMTGGRERVFWTRCIKGSYGAGAAGWAAMIADGVFGRSRERIRRFITPGKFMRDMYIQGGMPADRVFHLPHPLDPEWIAKGEGAGDYMLFLGRLAPYKGIMSFLKAAQFAKEVPCRIVGGGPLEGAVKDKIHDAKLANVTMSGWLSGDDLKRAVQGARAVVVPSEWHEPFGYVILEAMLAGRPVIASNIAGPAELVRNGDDGLLFPPHDATRLAEEMRALWMEPERAKTMGEAGRERVLTEFSPGQHYEKMMNHFKAVMQ